jgi:hypothetical protein
MSGNVAAYGEEMSASSLLEQLMNVDQATLVAALLSLPALQRPVGMELALSVTAADAQRAGRLPRPNRQYNDQFRTR